MTEQRIDALGRIVPDGFEPWPPESSAYAQTFDDLRRGITDDADRCVLNPEPDLRCLLALAAEHLPEDCPHYDEIAEALGYDPIDGPPSPGGYGVADGTAT